VRHTLADQGGPLPEQAREHAGRAEALAGKERAAAERLRRAGRLNRPSTAQGGGALRECPSPVESAT
jgi:hypothetical protein